MLPDTSFSKSSELMVYDRQHVDLLGLHVACQASFGAVGFPVWNVARVVHFAEQVSSSAPSS